MACKARLSKAALPGASVGLADMQHRDHHMHDACCDGNHTHEESHKATVRLAVHTQSLGGSVR